MHTKFIPHPLLTLLTIIVLFVTITAQSGAQSNSTTTTINYQGRLTDASGKPLTATLPMEFRLYATATGGTAVWNESWVNTNSVPVTNGLFSVLLGSLTPINTSLLNQQLYLGISVDGDPEMTPREKLGSVPYAAKADVATQAERATLADTATQATMAQSVADGSVTSAKIANGAVTGTQLATGTVGTSNLADNAVTGAKIADGTIGTVDLANGAVSGGKIANGAITGTQLATSAVGTTNLADSAVTGAKIADGTVATADLADKAVTSAKTTIATYHAEDNTYHRLTGGPTTTTLSTFTFNNVPAGNVFIEVTATVGKMPNGASGGTLFFDVGGKTITTVPTHGLDSDHPSQLTLHGHVPNFAGGTLTVYVRAWMTGSLEDMYFGASNGDGRFGRRITVIAGL